MSKEKDLLKKILATGWLNNTISCEVEELLAQPEQDNIQYLLDQVARLTAENAMLKEKWLAPPKREPLKIMLVLKLMNKYKDSRIDLIRAVEKKHGIGVDDE
jgi:hypothetical protein